MLTKCELDIVVAYLWMITKTIDTGSISIKHSLLDIDIYRLAFKKKVENVQC